MTPEMYAMTASRVTRKPWRFGARSEGSPLSSLRVHRGSEPVESDFRPALPGSHAASPTVISAKC